MSRIATKLAALEAAGKKALNTFITAGDPVLAATVPAMQALVAGGADLIELGVPFSDPEAEGPSIQASSERALKHGVTLSWVMQCVAAFRRDDDDTPVILMGYLNQFLKMGLEAFVDRAHQAGVDGVIIVNLPPEEAGEFDALLKARDMDLVLLAAPTTTPERAALIGAKGRGFLYYVSFKGTTGADLLDPDDVGRVVAGLRTATALPILVGFGIKDADSARRVAEHADGVVVGSALVDAMATTDPEHIPEVLTAKVRELRDALDSLSSTAEQGNSP